MLNGLQLDEAKPGLALDRFAGPGPGDAVIPNAEPFGPGAIRPVSGDSGSSGIIFRLPRLGSRLVHATQQKN
ncbi:MAG: hypothetical protein QOH05_893 [Acetobacteraceae bacterium]|nr:hypothetical protein [Acetobacteraceae bacterium]